MGPAIRNADFRRLFAIALSDLAVAEALLTEKDPRIRQEEICLHCHAALEKASKDFSAERLSFLDAYSSVARYENLLPSADRAFAEGAVQMARTAIAQLESHYVQENAHH